jgi:hypothetical protein
MMRICPKCGAYYAADSLAFCREDGAPLVNVEPNSKNWSQGTRVIQEQTKTLRKQTRRLKWRRIVTTSMSMTMITMVVTVVVLNTREYLKPAPEVVSQTNSNDQPDNKIVVNETEDDKPANDNQRNDNQRNDNQRNDNQRNDNQRNDNQRNDNQRNDNQRNDNQRNDNQRNDNQRNDNRGQDNNPCSADKQKDATGFILKEINQQWQWNSQSEQQLALSRIPALSSGPRGPDLVETVNRRRREHIRIGGRRGPERMGGPRGPGKIVTQTKGDQGGLVRAQPINLTHTSSFSRQCTEATVTFASGWLVWRAQSVPIKKIPISLVTKFRCTKKREGWSCPKSR